MKRFILFPAFLLVLAGCALPRSGSHQLQLLLTDAPASEADALWVTFGRIDLVPNDDSEEGIVTIAEEGGIVDVLQLRNGGIETLGDLAIPAGSYSQIRLIVESAEIHFGGGAEIFPVDIPSGAQTGLKIEVEPPLQASAGEASTIVMDFNAETGVIETPPGSQNYKLKPTAIRAVTSSGVVVGIVTDAVTTDPIGGAMVNVFDSTPAFVTSTTTEPDGSFGFISLTEGSYRLEVVAVGYELETLVGVGVTAGDTTDLATIPLTPSAP